MYEHAWTPSIFYGMEIDMTTALAMLVCGLWAVAGVAGVAGDGMTQDGAPATGGGGGVAAGGGAE